VAGERLQKIIARAGVTSRRKAEVLITAGRVAVNDEIVRELGSTADPRRDRITLDGRPLFEEERRYLLVNKPKRVLCALRDRFERPLITDLLGDEVRERVFPAGRLDYDSEGLVLLTNDGDLMEAITRPGRGVAKVYEVTVEGAPSDEDLRRLAGGVVLEAQPEWRPVGWQEEQAESRPESKVKGQMDEQPPGRTDGEAESRPEGAAEGQRTLPCTIERIERGGSDEAGTSSRLENGRSSRPEAGLDARAEAGPSSHFRVTLHEGKKNQIRRMFALIDAPVVRLVRVAIGALKMDDLKAGEYRSLSGREVEALRQEVQVREAGEAGMAGRTSP